ncbi:transposase [Streptomyces sp. NPDC001817]|uniref:transposase n=1 Tax=Streptomyces sp. NPDC001817 TaxID=3154398 RepID=UPI003327BB9D
MREAIAATRTTLTTLPGLGPVLAAKVIGHIGDISRFPTEHHFASYTGSAPLDASSGNNVRHRLNTGGNRALNSVLHTIARSATAGAGRTTTSARSLRGRHLRKPAGLLSDACPTWSTGS